MPAYIVDLVYVDFVVVIYVVDVNANVVDRIVAVDNGIADVDCVVDVDAVQFLIRKLHFDIFQNSFDIFFLGLNFFRYRVCQSFRRGL